MNTISHALRSFHERYCMYRFPGLSAPDLAPPELEGMAWSILTTADVTRLFAHEARREWAFQHFLKNGSVGVCISIGKDWAAHAWMSTPGRPRPPHVPSTVAPGAYWIYFCATKYGFGGKGLYKFAQRVLIQQAFSQQATPEILIDTTPDNLLSRRAIISTKFDPAGMLHCTYLWLPKVARLPLSCRWEQITPHPPLG